MYIALPAADRLHEPVRPRNRRARYCGRARASKCAAPCWDAARLSLRESWEKPRRLGLRDCPDAPDLPGLRLSPVRGRAHTIVWRAPCWAARPAQTDG